MTSYVATLLTLLQIYQKVAKAPTVILYEQPTLEERSMFSWMMESGMPGRIYRGSGITLNRMLGDRGFKAMTYNILVSCSLKCHLPMRVGGYYLLHVVLY